MVAEPDAIFKKLQEVYQQTMLAQAESKATFEQLRQQAGSASEITSRAEALRTQIEQAAQIAETRSKHIEDGRLYADAKRAELDTILTTAQQSATATEAANASAKGSLEAIATTVSSVQSFRSNAETAADAAGAARLSAEAHAVATGKLAALSEKLEATLADQEARLKTLVEEASRQMGEINKLVLGATNAGLAHAFDTRRKEFKRPALVWQGAFVGSIVVLLILAGVEAYALHTPGKIPEWHELLRLMMNRLPFLVPLVWMAIHAARQASLAMRMEEEYGFKATVSTSFEGYRRLLAEMGSGLGPETPLARLCSDTLNTISKPPGRVYDGTNLEPTPGSAAVDAVTPLVGTAAAAASNLVSGAPTKPGPG